jgi:hypothetical protein
MKDTQKSANPTTAVDQTVDGCTDEERATMKERAQELKSSSRRTRADKADGESDMLAKIAEMPDPDRALAEQGGAYLLDKPTRQQ